MASEIVQNFKNQFKIHPGFVIVFVAIVFIGLIFYKQIAQLFSARKDSATDPESTDLVLKREDKVDINFTKAVKSIKDKDQTPENVENTKQACTYIKDHKGKIPEEFKTITEQIMELTSNCTPVDCEGTWSDFGECQANVCSEVYRTYSISKEANILGKACSNKSGDKEGKVCSADKCAYMHVPYGKPMDNSPMFSEQMSMTDCVSNCTATSNCHFVTRSSENGMCYYYTTPDTLDSISFEFDSNVHTQVVGYKKDKVEKPDYTGQTEYVQEVEIATGVPIDANAARTYELMEGFTLYNNDLEEHANIATPEACQEKCSNLAACNYMAYDSEGNKCYLKSVVDDRVTVFKHPTQNIYSVKITETSEDGEEESEE